MEIGDVVEIIDNGFTYTTYSKMASFFKMENHAYGRLPSNKYKYLIKNIAPHLADNKVLLAHLENIETKKEYIMSLKGLRFTGRDFFKEEDFNL